MPTPTTYSSADSRPVSPTATVGICDRFCPAESPAVAPAVGRTVARTLSSLGACSLDADFERQRRANHRTGVSRPSLVAFLCAPVRALPSAGSVSVVRRPARRSARTLVRAASRSSVLREGGVRPTGAPARSASLLLVSFLLESSRPELRFRSRYSVAESRIDARTDLGSLVGNRIESFRSLASRSGSRTVARAQRWRRSRRSRPLGPVVSAVGPVRSRNAAILRGRPIPVRPRERLRVALRGRSRRSSCRT